MRRIELIGEMPCPAEIESWFVEGLPPPIVGERYPGETKDMYRANGLEMANGIILFDTNVTVGLALKWAGYARAEALKRGVSRLGPYADSQGVIAPGIGIWTPKALRCNISTVNRNLFTVD